MDLLAGFNLPLTQSIRLLYYVINKVKTVQLYP